LTTGYEAATFGIRLVTTVCEKPSLLDCLRAKRTLPPAEERRRIREAAGASLRAVADELGTSATSVIRWERGASPGARTLPYARLLDELKRIAE
jgi:DNA-binding transcriptional regulator YiaG